MKIKKIEPKTIILHLSLVLFFILQSCAVIPSSQVSIEKVVEGRFSLSFLKHNQSAQGRFMWKITSINNSEIEEFYFMDPWGKTHGILMRTLNEKLAPWILLNSNHQPIRKTHVENWLNKTLKLSSVKISSFIAPINLASEKIKKYSNYKDHNSIIKIVSNTNLGLVTMSLLPDKPSF